MNNPTLNNSGSRLPDPVQRGPASDIPTTKVIDPALNTGLFSPPRISGEAQPEALCMQQLGSGRPARQPAIDVESVIDDLSKSGRMPSLNGDMFVAVRSLLPSNCLHLEDLRPAELSEQIHERPKAADVNSLERPGYSATILDLATEKADRRILRAIHHLFELCAVDHKLRYDSKPTNGLWMIDAVRQIKERLAKPGSQLLCVVDPHGKLWGVDMYDTNPDDLLGEDRKLVCEVQRKLRLTKSAKVTTNYVASILDTVDKPLELGGLGVSRGHLYKCLHAAMISECRKDGVDNLVSYVRLKPTPNTALSAHERMGWKPVEGLLVRGWEFAPLIGTWREVINQAVILDVNSEQQDVIVKSALESDKVTFRDLDPS